MSDNVPAVLEIVPTKPTGVVPRNGRPDVFDVWADRENIEYMLTVVSDSGELFDIYLAFGKIDVRVTNGADTLVYVYVVDEETTIRCISACELSVLFSPDAL